MKVLITREDMKAILRILADRSFVMMCGTLFALYSLQAAKMKGV